MTPEHRVMNEVRLAMGEAGWLCFRCNVGTWETKDGAFVSTGLPRGFPDLIAFGPEARCVLIECKAPKGRLRPDQISFKRAIEALGFEYVVARSAADVAHLMRPF